MKNKRQFPTTRDLTQIAASIFSQVDGHAEAAARQAVGIWEACANEVDVLIPKRIDESIANEKMRLADEAEFNALNSVASETFSFDEALKRLMPGAKVEDREARCRKFFAEKYYLGDTIKAGESMAILRKKSISMIDIVAHFFPINCEDQIGSFTEWYERDMSKSRSIAGMAGALAAKNKAAADAVQNANDDHK